MDSNSRDSAGSLPVGEYASVCATYVPADRATSSAAAAPAPADVVRAFAVGEWVAVSYDAREEAIRSRIRRLNQSRR